MCLHPRQSECRRAGVEHVTRVAGDPRYSGSHRFSHSFPRNLRFKRSILGKCLGRSWTALIASDAFRSRFSLTESFVRVRTLQPSLVVERLIADVVSFCGSVQQGDDMTLMLVERQACRARIPDTASLGRRSTGSHCYSSSSIFAYARLSP
jgi:hypothetical protein